MLLCAGSFNVVLFLMIPNFLFYITEIVLVIVLLTPFLLMPNVCLDCEFKTLLLCSDFQSVFSLYKTKIKTQFEMSESYYSVVREYIFIC